MRVQASSARREELQQLQVELQQQLLFVRVEQQETQQHQQQLLLLKELSQSSKLQNAVFGFAADCIRPSARRFAAAAAAALGRWSGALVVKDVAAAHVNPKP